MASKDSQVSGGWLWLLGKEGEEAQSSNLEGGLSPVV